MAPSISWQRTQNLAHGSACSRFGEMGSSHSWQIPYVPSLTRISASSTSRSRVFSRLLRFRNSHSSWLCWLKSPESDGSSRRETMAAAFSADILRRSSLAFSRNALRLRSAPVFVSLLFIEFMGCRSSNGPPPLRQTTVTPVYIRRFCPLKVSENLQKSYGADCNMLTRLYGIKQSEID